MPISGELYGFSGLVLPVYLTSQKADDLLLVAVREAIGGGT
jgi:hypothetical protein